MGLINMSDPKYFGYTVNQIKSNVNLANMCTLDLTVLPTEFSVCIYTNSLFVIILPTRSQTENIYRKNTCQ